jgi:hypothetical protein
MSNLLEKASILTTPTAYDDGKILSVKPTPSLGSELVTNGGFDTDSGWNKQTSNWIIINGYAVCDGLQTSNSSLFQDVAVINGKSYRIDFTITNSVNNLNLILGATTIGQYGSGTHSIYVTKDSNASARIFFQATASNAFQGSLDNVSVKELIDGDFDFTRNSSATRVNAQGLIEDVASGLPRIDYTYGVGSWLFEPQSTNLVTYSEDFSQWDKSNAITVTSNATTSPSGELNASLLSTTTTNRFIYLSVNSAANSTFSIYVKWKNGSGGIDLSVDGGFNYTSVSVTSEWTRVSITPSSSITQLVLRIPTASELYVWAAQVEVQSFATSYIPTNGSTVTRLQDAAFGAGSSDLINSTEGVLYAEVSALANENLQRILSISDGTHNNCVKLGFSNSATDYRIFADVRLASVNQAFLTFNFGAVAPTFKKCAIKYKQNDFALWIDGVEVATDTSGNTFPADTLNELSFDRGGGVQNLFGKTKCVAVFKEALTDEELTCLTTI